MGDAMMSDDGPLGVTHSGLASIGAPSHADISAVHPHLAAPAEGHRDVREVARIITFLRKLGDVDHVADMLSAWAAKDPDTFARVCLELAEPAARAEDTPEHVLRQAHAAYARGDRTKTVVTLEREYNRLKKANNREYAALRKEKRAAA